MVHFQNAQSLQLATAKLAAVKGWRRIASGFGAMSSAGRALGSEQDQIRGLEVGADDYVSKTASEAMLLARVKKTLERAGRFPRIEAPTEMTKIQADIYRLLGSERGRFFSYVEIYEALCGEGYYHDEGAIRVHISRLRAKLPRGEKIESRRGRGYALVTL